MLFHKPNIIKHFYEGDDNFDYIIYFHNQDIAYKALGFPSVQRMNYLLHYKDGYMNDYSEDRIERVAYIPRQYDFSKPFRVTKSESTIANIPNIKKFR